ncbi:MAG: type I-C CRISPR-associated endonuclease Cas1 [Verrucomicrobiae bacterium]|nr:type I-C CRISPR-associated endonuclease Cas1 [Verrucomicrobiae bacterium]
MKRHLNTLFVTLEDAWLFKDGQAVAVRHEHETKLRVPLHNLDGIACFGWDIGASPQLMAACAEAGVTLSFHNPHGKFLCAVAGYSPGNVLLRREQYRRADDTAEGGAAVRIAREMVAAKIANCRTNLQRCARDHPDRADTVASTVRALARAAAMARETASLDRLRGIEGDAASAYFSVFARMLTVDDPGGDFRFQRRNRRPARDRVNALLSFLYALLRHDIRSACESCGLDAAVGFLHRDRPGRPGLALDLMEEFRPFLADRTALSLINRRQIQAADFEESEAGGFELKDKPRKAVLVAWQERKQEEIRHPFLDERTTVGLLVHLQARLLARHLRNDLDAYPPFLVR